MSRKVRRWLAPQSAVEKVLEWNRPAKHYGRELKSHSTGSHMRQSVSERGNPRTGVKTRLA
jgi:hypothetical protein